MRRTLVLFVLLGGCFESVPATFSDDDDAEAGGSSSASVPMSTSTASAPDSTSADDGASASSGFEGSTGGFLESSTGTGFLDSSTGFLDSSTGFLESSTGLLDSSSTEAQPVDPSESTSTGGPEPEPEGCGDGEPDPGEVCDEGDANGVEFGDCAPDCSAYVQERVIVVSEVNYDSAFAFGSDAVVDVLDAGCAAEFGAGAQAMFAFGDERRATEQAYTSQGAIDWVLDPWTRYLNDNGELVWTTESIPLLGVDADGALHDLEHPLWIYPENNPAFTGMNTDWTTQDDADCSGWTSIAGGPMASGNPWFVDDGDFLRLPGLSTCGNSRGIYCVLP